MSALLDHAPRFSSAAALLRHYGRVKERMRALAPPPLVALPSPEMMARGNPMPMPTTPAPTPAPQPVPRATAVELNECHDVRDIVPNQRSSLARRLKVLEPDAERAAVARTVRLYLRDVCSEPYSNKPRILVRCAAEAFKIDRAHLLSKERTHSIVRIRQIVMCLAGEVTGSSLGEIGKELGGRDHTTVLHGQKRRQALIDDVLSEIPHARAQPGYHRFKRTR